MDTTSEQVLSRKRSYLFWVELVKAFALLWIFLNHVVERLFGYPYIGNPWAEWAPIADRIMQLRPLDGHGIWDIPLNILRYIGWSGDQGVQLFIIISGFGLTWGLLNRNTGRRLAIGKFYLRRAERIFPLWWGAHLLFIFTWLFFGWGLSITDPSTYLSLLGIRITPALLYYFAPAWWYIWLLIQLYLVYPVLWHALNRIGPAKLLVITGLVAFTIRGMGLFLFSGYLDAWQRGAIFITRLPEFVFGISFAVWLYTNPEKTKGYIRSPLAIILAIGAYVVATLAALTLGGMTIVPFLSGVSIFVLLYNLAKWFIKVLPAPTLKPGIWTGQHTYSLYLIHHPMIILFIPPGAALTASLGLRLFAAILSTVLVASSLELVVNTLTNWIQNVLRSKGIKGAAIRVGAIGILFVSFILGVELLIRTLAPQEVLGWGERPSLESDAELGWHLIPSQEFHLRWESYDYHLASNAYGFPGPEFPPAKPAGVYRILVTGDAFTSAEGVDTDEAWPRLLETYLNDSTEGETVEVLNFAITGYGPNQYAAVVREFAPKFQPDLILVASFVNDYQDALLSNAEFQQSIGFGNPEPDSWLLMLTLPHLRRYINLHIKEPIVEILRNEPRPYGYFLGQYAAFEIDQGEAADQGFSVFKTRLGEIKTVADSIGAEVELVMIPAPVQICKPDQLDYAPRNVDIHDPTQFDLNLPQHRTEEIAGALEFPYMDLREPLHSEADICPYQPRNIHWNEQGHQIVARFIASRIMSGEYFKNN